MAEVHIKEFRLEDMPLSCTMIIIAPPATGKTEFMLNVAYYKRHIYPVAKVFIGTEDGYKRFCDIFPPLYVLNYYDEEEEKRYINRQKRCVMEEGKESLSSHSINIIDDASDDPKIYKTPLMKGIFKLGSQHWAQICMIGTQYSVDFPPDIRNAVSYVAIGRQPDEVERKKLYTNFGGICGSYERFCDLMDQLTGDYTFMVIKKRSQTNNIEDCVYWYKTKKLGSWKFGCAEYREHDALRRNANYQEQFM